MRVITALPMGPKSNGAPSRNWRFMEQFCNETSENECIPVKTRRTWPFALGLAASCMLFVPIATEAGHDDPGPPDAAEEPVAHFRNPTDAVVAFLEAVKAKDAVRLRDATSVRAPTEAKPKNRPLFTAILEQDLSEAALTELASTLEGYQAIGPGGLTKSGRTGFIVIKTAPDGTQFVRKFTVRWQKEPGWKVLDIGEQRELKKSTPTPPKVQPLFY
jgi:hypothetical protein